MTREQLAVAGIPILERNQNCTGGRNIHPAEDSQVGLDPERGGGDIDDADILGREEDLERPPTPPNVDVNNLADDVSAISLVAPNETPTNATTGAIMSYSTRIHVVNDVHYQGLERTLYIARLDLPGGIVEVDAMMKEDCLGMNFRFVDLPGACNGEQVGANMPPEIQRAINRDDQEELDGLELVNNTPHRLVPVTYPEMVEPYFICVDQHNFGAREGFIVYRNVTGTARRIALLGAFSKRNKPIRLVNNYVPTPEEIMHNHSVFFGNYMQAHANNQVPFCPIPQPQPPLQRQPQPQPQPPVDNNALIQQVLQRMRDQENRFQRQLDDQRWNHWMETLHTMANANPAVAAELNRLGNDFLDTLTPETFNALVARLNTFAPLYPPPQQQPRPQPNNNNAGNGPAAPGGNTIAIEDASSGSELT